MRGAVLQWISVVKRPISDTNPLEYPPRAESSQRVIARFTQSMITRMPTFS